MKEKTTLLFTNKKYVIHPKFEELQQALIDRNSTELHYILRNFSLLREEKLCELTSYKIMSNFYHENYLNPIVLAAPHCTASDSAIVQEILAAGFPVYDLASKLITMDKKYLDISTHHKLMHDKYPSPLNNEPDDYWFYKLLPHIQYYALSVQNRLNVPEKCVLTNKIPVVPLRINGKLYDFETLVWTINKDKLFKIDGKMAIEVIDDAVLDMEYIQFVHSSAKDFFDSVFIHHGLSLIVLIVINLAVDMEYKLSRDLNTIYLFFIIFGALNSYSSRNELSSRTRQAYNGYGDLPDKIVSRFKSELDAGSDKLHTLTFWKQVVCKNNEHNDVKNTIQNTEYNNTPAFRNILN